MKSSEIIDRAARAAAILFDRPDEETRRAALAAVDDEGQKHEPMALLFALYGKLPDASRLRVLKGGAR